MSSRGASTWMKLSEVSAWLGIDRKTVLSMVDNGEWPLPRLVGAQYIFRRSWVEHWDKTGEWPEDAPFKQGVGKGRVIQEA